MGYISEVNSIKMKLELGRILNESSLIKGIIEKHRASKWYKDAVTARRYYEDEHDILNHNFKQFKVKGVTKENPNAADNRIPNEFHTELVDQKVDYIAGNNPKFVSEDEGAKKFVEQLNKEFKTYIETTLIDWLTGASNSGEDALLVYINDNGEFDYTVCPGEQLILDKDQNGKLLSVMRFYYVDHQNEKGGLENILKVEIYDDRQVHYYVQKGKDGTFIKDISEPVNPKPHFAIRNTASNTTKEMGWGKPPFVFLKNNNSRKSDLKRIKALIDAYDKLISKGINTVEDIQEVLYVLRGYTGTELDEALEKIKVNKVITVDATPGAGAETLKAEVPVEAVNVFEKLIRKNIYAFGRGVDFSSDNVGGEMRTISIKFMFARLELKANQMIRQLQMAILNLCEFYATYWAVKPGGTNEYLQVYDKVTLEINKRLLINESEKITDCQNSTGQVSEETILENHPFVKDVQKELERKKAEFENNPPVNFQQ